MSFRYLHGDNPHFIWTLVIVSSVFLCRSFYKLSILLTFQRISSLFHWFFYFFFNCIDFCSYIFSLLCLVCIILLFFSFHNGAEINLRIFIFYNICTWCYKFPSHNCFNCLLQILILCFLSPFSSVYFYFTLSLLYWPMDCLKVCCLAKYFEIFLLSFCYCF